MKQESYILIAAILIVLFMFERFASFIGSDFLFFLVAAVIVLAWMYNREKDKKDISYVKIAAVLIILFFIMSIASSAAGIILLVIVLVLAWMYAKDTVLKGKKYLTIALVIVVLFFSRLFGFTDVSFPVGVGILSVIAICIVLSLIYVETKKLYNVMYGLSAITQVITVVYVIGAFEFGKNGILLTLVAAAFLMMAEGYMISRKKKK